MMKIPEKLFPALRRNENFTLIELLIVITIIAILAAMLLPALNSAREKAFSVQCLSNQKSLGMATAQYMQDSQDWIPFVQESFDNHPPYEWKVLLDPYVQRRAKYLKHGFTGINQRIFRCPSWKEFGHTFSEKGYDGGIEIVICIPGGKEAAQKTFNPMLGVEGGLSILGTSGIVEPMSEQALVDTIAVELRQAAALGAKRLILTPGNYGEDFLRENQIAEDTVPVVKCSNFIGDALDIASTHPFTEVLLVGHIGKLVKLAGGVMNTHSRYADCRTELVCAHAAVCGASPETCLALLQAATTDACIEILDSAQLRVPVLDRLLEAIQQHLEHRVRGKYQIGAVLFSNQYGLLGQTQMAKEIMESWK